MADIPDTPAQAKAREAYNAACQELAAASHQKKEAQARYDAAFLAYISAYGAAKQAGVA